MLASERVAPTSPAPRRALRALAAAVLVASVVLIASSSAASAGTGRCPAIDNGSLRNIVAVGVSCNSADYLLARFAAKRSQWKQRLRPGNTTFVTGQSQMWGWDCYASGPVQNNHVHQFGLVCTRGMRTASGTLTVA